MSMSLDEKLDLIADMIAIRQELVERLGRLHAMCGTSTVINWPTAKELLVMLFDSLCESDAVILAERLMVAYREQQA
jgi:hypothetical protein